MSLLVLYPAGTCGGSGAKRDQWDLQIAALAVGRRDVLLYMDSINGKGCHVAHSQQSTTD